MIRILCPSVYEPLLIEHGARLVEGCWCLNSLPEQVKLTLQSTGVGVEGCRYKCWDTWYNTLYQITRDARCTVSFNTLAKRSQGLIELDGVVTGRAKPKARKLRDAGTYYVEYQGKIYPSETAIAREFGLNLTSFRSRRQNHTLEEVLAWE